MIGTIMGAATGSAHQVPRIFQTQDAVELSNTNLKQKRLALNAPSWFRLIGC
jgi:hypothetical protein